MKRLLLTIAILALSFGIAFAGSVRLAWDTNPQWEELVDNPILGFYIKFTDGTKNYAMKIEDSTVREALIEHIPPGIWTFSATAFNLAEESPDSNTVEGIIEPFVPPDSHLPAVQINITAPSVTITVISK